MFYFSLLDCTCLTAKKQSTELIKPALYRYFRQSAVWLAVIFITITKLSVKDIACNLLSRTIGLKE
ncbi:hypothetical protein AJE_09719 [Alishewanella jeotgali KCTC 22429]|uniref:Uncharacterized protein n=1 Tax=Alishewanella jeotgali KCTC 22429 TaxID=1129374 RepID=H3ZF09_9ALTE|nr:hypothetical protein AJE_09719 [Alishewanella jeotgali KCTC 22429]